MFAACPWPRPPCLPDSQCPAGGLARRLGEGLPSDLKEGGTGIGWRDRHWQPREQGGARGGPRARRPVGPSTAPSPPARTVAAGSLPLPSRRHCLCASLFHPGVAAGPGWTSQPGVQRLCGAPSARQCPLGGAARGAAPRGAERGRPRGAPGKPRAVGWSRLPFWGGSQVVRGGPSAQSTPDGPRGHVQTLGSGGPDSGPVRRPHSASPVGWRVFEGALPPSAPSPAPCGSGLRLREAPGVSA